MYIFSKNFYIPKKKDDLMPKFNNLQVLFFLFSKEKCKISEDQKECEIKISGFPMPIRLKMLNNPEKEDKIHLTSVGMPISFDLIIEFKAEGEQTQTKVIFDGKSINMFIKPMIEKPLQQLMDQIPDRVAKYFEEHGTDF